MNTFKKHMLLILGVLFPISILWSFTKTMKEPDENEEASEHPGETKGASIDEIEILEKSMHVVEEIASMDGWTVRRDLKYPYPELFTKL